MTGDVPVRPHRDPTERAGSVHEQAWRGRICSESGAVLSVLAGVVVGVVVTRLS